MSRAELVLRAAVACQAPGRNGIQTAAFFRKRGPEQIWWVRWNSSRLVRATLLANRERIGRDTPAMLTRPLEEYLAAHTDKKFLLMACGPGPMPARHGGTCQKIRHPAWSRWKIAWVADWERAWVAASGSRAKGTKPTSASALKGRCSGGEDCLESRFEIQLGKEGFRNRA